MSADQSARSPAPALPPRRRGERLLLAWGRFSLFGAILMAAVVAADRLSVYVLGPSPVWIENKFPVEDTRHPRPYSMFGGKQTANNKDFQNDLGYRGPRPGAEKPLGEVRLFMLGGSTMYWGDPPIATLVEEHFRRAGIDQVQVYNFGCVSQGSGMELARVTHEILAWQPDLVVFYDGINDILSPTFGDPRPGYPYNFPVYENNPLLTTEAASHRLWVMLLAKSNLVKHYAGNWINQELLPLDRLGKEVRAGSAQWREEIAACYVNNVVHAQATVRAVGGEFLAILQPSGFLKRQRTPEEQGPDLNEVGLAAHVPDVAERVRRLAAQAVADGRLNFFDLSRIYENTAERKFTDSMHVTQEANAQLAAEIFERLQSLIAQSPRLAGRFEPGHPVDRADHRAWSLWAQAPTAVRIESLDDIALDATASDVADDAGRAQRDAPRSTDRFRVNVESAQAERPQAVELFRLLPPVAAGQVTQVRFTARADRPRDVLAAIVPYTNLARPTGAEQTLALTEHWSTITLEFSDAARQDDLTLSLLLGAADGVIEFRDFALQYPPPEFQPPATPAEASSAFPRTPNERRAAQKNERRIAVWDNPYGRLSGRFPAGPNGPMRVEAFEPGQIPERAHLSWSLGVLPPGEKQELTLALRADRPTRVNIGLVRADGQPGNFGVGGDFDLTVDWQLARFDFVPPAGADANLNITLSDPRAPIEISSWRHRGPAPIPCRLSVEPVSQDADVNR